MILDNLFRDRKTQPAPLGFSEAHEGLKNSVPNRQRNAGTVIPNPNLQTGSIPGGRDDDLPRLRRNRLARIQQKIGHHSFETVGVEPAQRLPLHDDA